MFLFLLGGMGDEVMCFFQSFQEGKKNLLLSQADDISIATPSNGMKSKREEL